MVSATFSRLVEKSNLHENRNLGQRILRCTYIDIIQITHEDFHESSVPRRVLSIIEVDLKTRYPIYSQARSEIVTEAST
jgi:hypothetical protein